MFAHRRMGTLVDGDVTPGACRGPDTLHAIAISTRETEFGSIIQPIPITLTAYHHLHSANRAVVMEPRRIGTTTSVIIPNPGKEAKDISKITRAPPKKKWIREYLEEEPAPAAGAERAGSPPAPHPPPAHLAFAHEHSRPRAATGAAHGPPQIPSPPSVGSSSSISSGGSGSSSGSASSGSASSGNASGGSSSAAVPRAGTREVHNKLEKNRRAHLKECFELLKRQLPSTTDDKKTSNLSILGSAIRYIQVLRRKERECEHEMERLAREKIAAQQRLAALKRDVTLRAPLRLAATSAIVCAPDTITDDADMDDRVNGHVLGITTPSSPPASPRPTATAAQNGVVENGVVTNTLNTLVHPAQIHLPISQGGPAAAAGAGPPVRRCGDHGRKQQDTWNGEWYRYLHDNIRGCRDGGRRAAARARAARALAHTQDGGGGAGPAPRAPARGALAARPRAHTRAHVSPPRPREPPAPT